MSTCTPLPRQHLCPTAVATMYFDQCAVLCRACIRERTVQIQVPELSRGCSEGDNEFSNGNYLLRYSAHLQAVVQGMFTVVGSSSSACSKQGVAHVDVILADAGDVRPHLHGAFCLHSTASISKRSIQHNLQDMPWAPKCAKHETHHSERRIAPQCSGQHVQMQGFPFYSRRQGKRCSNMPDNHISSCKAFIHLTQGKSRQWTVSSSPEELTHSSAC